MWPSSSSFPLLAVLTAYALPVVGQVVPATPSQFGKRSTGAVSESGGSSSIGLRSGGAQPQPSVRQISYIALSDSRQFTSTEGRTLIGKLIAWEQSEQQLAPGQDPTLQPAPSLPAKPTLLRDDKVRLLIQQKPFEVALDRLSPADQAFIKQLQSAIERSQPKTPVPTKTSP